MYNMVFFFLSSYLKANSISSIVRYFDNRQTIQIVLWCQKHPLSFKRATTVYESVCKTSGWILLMKFINQIYICMFAYCVKIWIKLFLQQMLWKIKFQTGKDVFVSLHTEYRKVTSISAEFYETQLQCDL